MSKPTPGPWLVENCYLGSSTIAQMRSPDRLVCINAAGGADAKPPGFKATDANARLIAAAPNLLAALKSLMNNDGSSASLPAYDTRCVLAVEALAKAEGQ